MDAIAESDGVEYHLPSPAVCGGLAFCSTRTGHRHAEGEGYRRLPSREAAPPLDSIERRVKGRARADRGRTEPSKRRARWNRIDGAGVRSCQVALQLYRVCDAFPRLHGERAHRLRGLTEAIEQAQRFVGRGGVEVD